MLPRKMMNINEKTQKKNTMKGKKKRNMVMDRIYDEEKIDDDHDEAKET